MISTLLFPVLFSSYFFPRLPLAVDALLEEYKKHTRQQHVETHFCLVVVSIFSPLLIIPRNRNGKNKENIIFF
jgi:hypothetical protein